MESSTLQRSRQATEGSLLSLTLMRKWACCEVDSPAKHPRSNRNSIAPSIPIFTVTAEVWLVSDLMPFELAWTFWFSLILINMWPNLQLLQGDYSESFESACTHAQPAVSVCAYTLTSRHSIIRLLSVSLDRLCKLWLDPFMARARNDNINNTFYLKAPFQTLKVILHRKKKKIYRM